VSYNLNICPLCKMNFGDENVSEVI